MSENKIYVGNLSFTTTQNDLEQAFTAFGTVQSVSLVTDRDTGRPRGFAFVEMGTDVIGSTPQQFGAFIESESAKWARVIKEANIRAE